MKSCTERVTAIDPARKPGMKPFNQRKIDGVRKTSQETSRQIILQDAEERERMSSTSRKPVHGHLKLREKSPKLRHMSVLRLSKKWYAQIVSKLIYLQIRVEEVQFLC